MEGDPSLPVIVDTWMKGLRDFDINLAYEAMYKSATMPGKDNLMRPDIDDYITKGYVPLMEQYDNSVSHALEYYIADYALSTLAKELGKKDDAKMFYNRSMGYKNYYCKGNTEHYVQYCLTVNSTARLIRNRAKTSSRVLVSTKEMRGTIHIMFLMT